MDHGRSIVVASVITALASVGAAVIQKVENGSLQARIEKLETKQQRLQSENANLSQAAAQNEQKSNPPGESGG